MVDREQTVAQAPIPMQDPEGRECLHLQDTRRQQDEIGTPTHIRAHSSSIGHEDHSSKPLNPAFQLLYTIAWLTLFSILGTLARIGLSALTTYPGAPLSGVIWANFAGCVVMGFLNEDRKLFHIPPPADDSLSKLKLPLYLGLTTGFCGSFTSFSSFILVAFQNMANLAPSYNGRPTKGYNLIALLGYIIATLALSLSGLQLGGHISVALHKFLPTLSLKTHAVLNWSSLLLAIGTWAGAVIMTALIPRWRGDALFACVFSPLGVYVRFWVSRWFNPRVKSFPLGTFMVNIVGTAILSAITVGRDEVITWVGCQMLRGAGDGFCGCLTTVSTFALELKTLRTKYAYFYGGSSVVLSFCVMVLVTGSYTWTHGGLYEPKC